MKKKFVYPKMLKTSISLPKSLADFADQMMKILGLLLILYTADAGRAQTVTNWVRSAENFRVVNGQLYNVEKSSRFESFQGEVVAVTTNGIILAEQVEKTYPERTSSVGGYVATPPGQSPGKTRWELNGKMMFVKHYPAKHQATVGSSHFGEAMDIGTYDWQGDIIKCYDYGLPNYAMVISTNGRQASIITTNHPVAKARP
jgi:hypothetical protein